jgi:hypothetical protein
MLAELGNIEMASKMLLGALQCAPQMNPVDYCLKALNLKIESLSRNSEEYKLLIKYIYNTWSERKNGDTEIKAIFRI